MGTSRGRRVSPKDKDKVIELITEAKSKGCRQEHACEDMGISERTFNRWNNRVEDLRKGPLTLPSNKLREEERQEVLKLCKSKEYRDLSPSQIVPDLADKGTYVASESTMYRILKEENLLAHRGKSKAPEHKKPASLVAYGPNEIYTWDITYLKSTIRGRFFYLYMFIDIFDRKIVGADVFFSESMEYSSRLVEKICKRENIKKNQLTLHSDNGGPMKGATMLSTLQSLGVVPSFSRPRVSDDNPYSESLFKTLKYSALYPSKPFESLDAAKNWVHKFTNWYNNVHKHSGIKFVTPAQGREGKDKEILEKRSKVYELAKRKNPDRWSGKTRNWNRINAVHLNHLNKNKKEDIKILS